MKRAILALSVMFLAYGGYAQGYLKYQNASASLITTNLFGTTGNMGGGPGKYNFMLLVGPDAGTPVFVDNSLFNTNGPVGGRMVSRGVTPVPGSSEGFVSIQLVGWSVNLGGTYQEFLANKPTATTGFWGESAIGRVSLGSATGTATLPAIMVDGSSLPAGWTQIPGFALNAVPEPSAIALGVLGLGALVLFRRRKN